MGLRDRNIFNSQVKYIHAISTRSRTESQDYKVYYDGSIGNSCTKQEITQFLTCFNRNI